MIIVKMRRKGSLIGSGQRFTGPLLIDRQATLADDYGAQTC
jgi:hypothetical protein